LFGENVATMGDNRTSLAPQTNPDPSKEAIRAKKRSNVAADISGPRAKHERYGQGTEGGCQAIKEDEILKKGGEGKGFYGEKETEK